METVKVYSTLEDKKIRENFVNSPIWKSQRYHITEFKEAQEKHDILYEYTFKFDGIKLVQFSGVKKIIKEKMNKK